MLKRWTLFLLLLALTLGGTTASHALEPATGRLLLANKKLNDSNFTQTVILITGHDHGSMGIILNRPTGLKVADVLTEVKEVQDRPTTFNFGGPVDKKQILTLVRSGKLPDNSSKVVGRTGMSDLKSVLDHFGDEHLANNLRVYLGYASWAPGQLKKEIARADWLVLPRNEEVIYDPDPKKLWQRLWKEHGLRMTEEEEKKLKQGDQK